MDRLAEIVGRSKAGAYAISLLAPVDIEWFIEEVTRLREDIRHVYEGDVELVSAETEEWLYSYER